MILDFFFVFMQSIHYRPTHACVSKTSVKPLPLENCTVVNQTATFIHVECSSHREPPPIPDQPLFRIMNGDGGGGSGASSAGANGIADPSQAYHHDPAQYGLFPEYYVMEVWDLKNRSIRRNLSAEAPIFMLKGLAPGSWLRLVLYAANSHGKSDPHVIEAVTAGDAEKHTLGKLTRIYYYHINLLFPTTYAYQILMQLRLHTTWIQVCMYELNNIRNSTKQWASESAKNELCVPKNHPNCHKPWDITILTQSKELALTSK